MKLDVGKTELTVGMSKLPSLGGSVKQLGSSEGELSINVGIKGPRGHETRKYTFC